MADLHGWQSDPFGLHEQRYFSQGQPTKLVRDGSAESYDPPPTASAASGTPAPGGAHSAAPVSGPTQYPAAHAPSAPESPSTPALLPVPPRPGWWLASDGNWYPPETHPDATSAESVTGS